MINNNLKPKGQAGFTIVELLIVIVVIGILAAITIVAYSGITNRANTTKAQTNAANVLKVTEAYNADPLNTTGYPTLANLTGYSALATSVAKYPAVILVTAAAPTSANGTTNLLYIAKGTTGGCIGYYDFTAGNVKVVYAGNATVSDGATTCS